MKNLIKKFGILLLMIIILSGVFSLFSKEFQTTKEITLSQLVNEINQGKVKKIIVAYDDSLEIIFQDDSKAESIKEKETSLSESLLNFGLNTENLNKIDIESKKESGMSLWIGPLILILPLILIFIFLFITLQKAKTGAMDAFSFTKAHPRIFMGGSQKEKTTLKDVGGLKEAKE